MSHRKYKQSSQLTENVESMNKDDIDKIVGEVTDGGYSISKFGSLLANETYYWLTTNYNATKLWDVNANGNIYCNLSSSNNNNYNISYGIRAKVTLVEGVW